MMEANPRESAGPPSIRPLRERACSGMKSKELKHGRRDSEVAGVAPNSLSSQLLGQEDVSGLRLGGSEKERCGHRRGDATAVGLVLPSER